MRPVEAASPVGEPDAAQIALQAERYDKMLQACLNVPACTSFTVWGFDDGRSWVPGVFPEGYATIMTEDFVKKPAYYALLESLTDATPGKSPRTAPGLNK